MAGDLNLSLGTELEGLWTAHRSVCAPPTRAALLPADQASLEGAQELRADSWARCFGKAQTICKSSSLGATLHCTLIVSLVPFFSGK